MREFREVGPDRIDDYMYIYLNAYPAFKSLDEDCWARYRAKVLRDMELDEKTKFYGGFEDGKMCAIMKLIDFDINLYGRMQKAVGVMSLAVHPMEKKKGWALDSIHYSEQYARERGALVNMFLPFSMGFYRKMGYGLGSKLDEYHLSTANLPRCADLSRMRMMTLDDLDGILACNERMVRSTHGMISKFEEEVRILRGDKAALFAGYEEEGALRGYVMYRYEDAHEDNYTINRISVEELVYDSGEVLRTLLGFLRNQADLAQTIVIRTQEPDFYQLLDDPRDVCDHYINYGYLQTNVSAVGNMYKVLDPDKFVDALSYRPFPKADVTVRFDYEDEMEHCESQLTVRFFPDGEGSRWKAAPGADPDVTVRCRKADLSSLLLNSCRFASMVRVGAMTVSDPSYVKMLDDLLYWNEQPFSNVDY